MDLKSCEICNENRHKYKCPKCLTKYCSLQCFKIHKGDEKCISKSQIIQSNVKCSPPVTMQYQEKEEGEISDEDETSEDYVAPQRLQKLATDESLERMLENPHLRQMLSHLTSTEETDKDMDSAMHEPIFVEFADKCLQIVMPEKFSSET